MAMASCSVITLGLFFNKRWIFIASAAICGMVSSFTPTSRRFLGMPHLALSSLIFSTPVRNNVVRPSPCLQRRAGCWEDQYWRFRAATLSR